MAIAPSNRTSASLNSASGPPGRGVFRDGAVVGALREIIAREDIRESRSAEDEGIFFAFEGPGEVSLQYNIPEHESVALAAASSPEAKHSVFRCCSVLAEHGFAVTLVASPRTLALFVNVRTEFERPMPRAIPGMTPST